MVNIICLLVFMGCLESNILVLLISKGPNPRHRSIFSLVVLVPIPVLKEISISVSRDAAKYTSRNDLPVLSLVPHFQKVLAPSLDVILLDR
jgi:hypothetical protein